MYIVHGQTILVNTAAVHSNDWTTGEVYKWLAVHLWAVRQLQLSSSAAHLPINVRSIMLTGTCGVVYELMQTFSLSTATAACQSTVVTATLARKANWYVAQNGALQEMSSDHTKQHGAKMLLCTTWCLRSGSMQTTCTTGVTLVCVTSPVYSVPCHAR